MILLKIFRLTAFLEGISYLLLLFVAVPIKYVGNDPSYVKLLGMPHGLLFVLYIVLSIALMTKNNWVKNNLWWILIASIVPFGTFVVDNKIRHSL